jgi:phosphatidylserine/phosphatidylglycerophosphate/cardiolipin synthase-like enzyme
MLLLNALRDARSRGVDVQLIASEFEGPHVEAMHELGLTPVLRIQQNVHNKGIVVDSTQVLVSSQNWSAAGTLRNRDAGVIIHHAGIAQYFEQIFMEDWAHRARPVLAEGADRAATKTATTAKPAKTAKTKKAAKSNKPAKPAKRAGRGKSASSARKKR